MVNADTEQLDHRCLLVQNYWKEKKLMNIFFIFRPSDGVKKAKVHILS